MRLFFFTELTGGLVKKDIYYEIENIYFNHKLGGGFLGRKFIMVGLLEALLLQLTKQVS